MKGHLTCRTTAVLLIVSAATVFGCRAPLSDRLGIQMGDKRSSMVEVSRPKRDLDVKLLVPVPVGQTDTKTEGYRGKLGKKEPVKVEGFE